MSRRQLVAGAGAAGALSLAAIGARAGFRADAGPGQPPPGFRSLADYGRIGTPDDTKVFQAALADIARQGARRLWIPPGRYIVTSTLELGSDGLRIEASGATVLSPMQATQPLVSVTGNNVAIVGLSTVLTAASTNSHHYRVTGKSCSIDQCSADYRTDQNTPAFYVKGGDGLRLTNSVKRGSNAFIGYLEASDVVIDSNRIYGTGRGDDAIALKAIERSSENIRITRNSVFRHAALVSFGTQVGKKNADDPSHSLAVRNVIVSGNVAESCARLAYIKPGAGKYDYRDGLVENVEFSDNALTDLAGAAFQTGFDIRAGRGAIVRSITGGGNVIRARASGDSSTGRKVGALLIQAAGGGSTPTIGDIDIGIEFDDPDDGAAAGGIGVAGYPVENIVRIDPKGLRLGKVNLRIVGNGSAESGALILPGAGQAISVEELKLRHYNARNLDRQGGLRTASPVVFKTDKVELEGHGQSRLVDPGGSLDSSVRPPR